MAIDTGRVGFLEHEVDRWIWRRVRADTKQVVGEPAPVPDHPRIISMAEVQRRVGFSRVHLWRLERAGKFPRRLKLKDLG